MYMKRISTFLDSGSSTQALGSRLLFGWRRQQQQYVRIARLLSPCLFVVGLATVATMGLLKAEALTHIEWQSIDNRSQLLEAIWNQPMVPFHESQIMQSLESASIIVAAIAYLTSRQDEQRRTQLQASFYLDTAGGRETSYARNASLEHLNSTRFPLKGLDVPQTDLQGIQLPCVVLSEATLDGAMLQDANLFDGQLDGASLQAANLEHAHLQNANLFDANLQDANLGNAKLMKADFSCADLQCASFFHADVDRANFKNANLKDTDFRHARHLLPEQVKQGKNWHLAVYDDEFETLLFSSGTDNGRIGNGVHGNRLPTPTYHTPENSTAFEQLRHYRPIPDSV